MTLAPDALVLDLIEWVAVEPKPYRDVIEAWRTSCPRLTVWEDAVDRGFLERRIADGSVAATPSGLSFLIANGRRVA
jgi:hypothetical protein